MMVLRIFVQPGEGNTKHWLVPKRKEPLAANPTISYSVITSTALAAGYASYSASFARRVGFQNAIPLSTLFVRASAKVGVWCALTGAAVNWYYHHAFIWPVTVRTPSEKDYKWKIWERTEKYTVDDGFLAGAGLGLGLGLVSAVVARRSPLRWWTRAVGMTNLGACAGIIGSNAYFQYTGERQKAIDALRAWENRRNLMFYYIYWNRVLLTRFPVLVQAYIRWKCVFHASLLPEDVLKNPTKYRAGILADDQPVSKDASVKNSAETTPEKAVWHEVDDYVAFLKRMDLEQYQSKIDESREKQKSLLREAEFIRRKLSQMRRILCMKEYAGTLHADEREDLLRASHYLEAVLCDLRKRAHKQDVNQYLISQWVVHKAAWDAGSFDPQTWYAGLNAVDEALEPKIAAMSLDDCKKELVAYEEDCMKQQRDSSLSAEQKKLAMERAEDSRKWLRAIEFLCAELQKGGAVEEVGGKKVEDKDDDVASPPPGDSEPEKS